MCGSVNKANFCEIFKNLIFRSQKLVTFFFYLNKANFLVEIFPVWYISNNRMQNYLSQEVYKRTVGSQASKTNTLVFQEDKEEKNLQD